MKRTIKYYFFGMTICFCHLTLFAQNKNIDSLLTLLKTDKPDTNKVIHLNKLFFEYINIGLYDTALRYVNGGLLLAQKLNFKKGIATSSSNIGLVYNYQGDYPQALDYHVKALKISEQLGDKREIARHIGNIGNVYAIQGDYPQALDYYVKALKISGELSDKSGMARHLGNIGLVYSNQDNYPKALEYYFRALKIAEELGDKVGMARHFGNIGLVYSNQDNYPKALDYYFRALKISEELGDKSGAARHLGNIGILFKKQANYPKSLDYYFKAMEIAKELGDKNMIARHIGNIGNVYALQGDYPKALEGFLAALRIKEEIGDKNGIATWLGNIGNVYVDQKKYKKAYIYIYQALALSDSIGSKGNLEDNYNTLSKLYEKSTIPLPDSIGGKVLTMEEMRLRAIYYYKQSITIRDTIFSQENKKQLVRKEMNYLFDKKEAVTKAENEKQQAIAEASSRKQKIIIWSVVFGLLLVVMFAGFIFRSLRITRKQKQIIEIKSKETEEQKKIVEEKNKLVEEKQKEILDSINYANRIQRAILPHRRDIWTAFPESFVLFKPKDIVSGDFYFFHKNEQSAFIATADCTGHGVPGAFMSMIGAGKLNDAVSESSDTSEILSLLNKGIKSALKQTDDDKSTRDGMDIALCSVNTENRSVKYAGANRPLWIIRNGQTEVEEIKATKTAIGGLTEDSQYFDTHVLKLQQGDTFYISTDGYADQFGGHTGKKLMTKKFKEILLEIQSKTMKEQEQHLNNFIENWKEGTEQVDDILIIGIRL